MYFLGIITKRDMQRGRLIPSYVLAKRNVNRRRTPFYVETLDYMKTSFADIQHMLLLFDSKSYHDQFLQMMAKFIPYKPVYRGRRLAFRYTPVDGYLCWFQCNMNGAVSGPVQVIVSLPQGVDKKLSPKRFSGKVFTKWRTGKNQRAAMDNLIDKDLTLCDLLLGATQL